MYTPISELEEGLLVIVQMSHKKEKMFKIIYLTEEVNEINK
jgi:hypothetical protein